MKLINGKIADDDALYDMLRQWYNKDEHHKIIDTILGIPEENRSYKLYKELACAYNNAERYDEALNILELIKEEGQSDHLWHYVLGYAYFHTEQISDALAAFNRALALYPNRTDYKEWIKSCQDALGNQEIGATSSSRLSYPENPISRQLVLWGTDSEQNPGFLILYGMHQPATSGEHSFEANMTYTGYAIYKGKEGHFPSFENVTRNSSNYYSNDDYDELYYKTYVNAEYGHKDNVTFSTVESFVKLPKDQQITLPYYDMPSYKELVTTITNQIHLTDFHLVEDPNDLLKVSDADFAHLSVVFGHPNLYMRKKALNSWLETHPSLAQLQTLLKLGSSELISGLFLALAQAKNNILIESAKELVQSNITWTSPSYAKGVMRCANLYIHALDENLKAERVKWLRENIHLADLHLTHINGNPVDSNKVLQGARYRSLYYDETLRSSSYRYEMNPDTNRYEYRLVPATKRYEIGPFTKDGIFLDTVALKHALQEAEIFEAADVIGKIAYYLDAPRLTYLLKSSTSGQKVKRYFTRKIDRILKHYADARPDLFMEAMRALFTSYHSYDYVCKYHNNFQFNYYIKHYLYGTFNQPAPTNYYQRWQWNRNDHLLASKGNYVYRPEIWANHLDIVIDIAAHAHIQTIQKACYYILKEAPHLNEYVNNISYDQLLSLAALDYKPLADIFLELLSTKLHQSSTFDIDLALSLMSHSHTPYHQIALDYMTAKQGKLAPYGIAQLLTADTALNFKELLTNELMALSESDYVIFIKAFIYAFSSEKAQRFLDFGKELPDALTELLLHSMSKMKTLSAAQATSALEAIIRALTEIPVHCKPLSSFLEETTFSFSFEMLQALLEKVTFEKMSQAISMNNKKVFDLLKAIKENSFPGDSEVISLLETGSAPMLAMLAPLLERNHESLKTRPTTLLLLMECNMVSLNNGAKAIFEDLTNEDAETSLKLLIDSPIAKVYEYGLAQLEARYNGFIPESYLLMLMEHPHSQVKAYIANQLQVMLQGSDFNNPELFMYYTKTLLLLPNKVSKDKDTIYRVLPLFIKQHPTYKETIETLLLTIGGSNIQLDVERSLVTLAYIRKEAISYES